MGFRVAGWLLGVPSLLAFLCFTAGSFTLHQMAAPDGSHYLDIGTYGLVGLLANAARGLDQFFAFLAGVGVWVAVVLAIMALIAALHALFLYLVGRGIAHRALWARIMGGVVSMGLLLLALGVWSLVGRNAAIAASVVAAVSLYSLWVLGWRFAERPARA